MQVSYVLPLRWREPGPIDELAGYLRTLREEVAEIIVVDGSPSPSFELHAEKLAGIAAHVAPRPDLEFPMGKVNGVITGVERATAEFVVIADDDVRYDQVSMARTVGLLERADLVRPQNYFDPLSWHARWDTGRSLLNRVFTGDPAFPVGDFPGTLAVRRSAFLAAGAYDGRALFENLELMRTIKAAGGTVLTPLDLYVARLPPSAAHFLSQRVRQAYDDFAIPFRLAAFLALGPLSAELLRRGKAGWVVGASLGTIALAEAGRRRAGGSTRFPLSSALLAPVWVAERAVCSWLALGARMRGGVRYGDRRLARSASSLGELRRRGDSYGSSTVAMGAGGPLSA